MQISCDGILFDNDGVLVDSHVQVVEAWTQWTSEFDLDYEALADELIGVPAADTINNHLPPEVAAVAIPRLEDLEVELAAQTPPVAGAVELTSFLPTGSWSVVTSASRRLAIARWKGAGIVPPAKTVTADDITHGKPNPEPFLTGARLLEVDPRRCVVFEDSPSGGVAGAAAGATVVAVGDLEWTVEPAARIADLTQVSVSTAPDGSLLLDVQS